MKRLMLLAILAASIFSAGAHAGETCAWFRAASVPGDWWIVHGKCEITVKGDKFTAQLFDSDIPTFLRYKVSGVIRGDKVSVSIETQNSDAGLETMEGILTKGDLYKNVILLGSGYNSTGIKFGPN